MFAAPAMPLLYTTVGVALEEAAVRWPERDALICSHQGIRWSYRQLNDAADRLAAGFWEPVPGMHYWSCWQMTLLQPSCRCTASRMGRKEPADH
jgi:acyl-CoA synthetase (AMP-forming)/AMP-acid ligase II